MKLGMRQLASGVSVLACRGADTVRHAMTVTSVSSLSDNPASLLVCVHRETLSNKVLQRGTLFSVNVLNAAQADISQQCALNSDDETRFVLGDWQDHGHAKLPYLRDGIASFVCTVANRIEHGTHHIIIGDIQQVYVNSVAALPLIYCDGQYSALQKS